MTTLTTRGASVAAAVTRPRIAPQSGRPFGAAGRPSAIGLVLALVLPNLCLVAGGAAAGPQVLPHHAEYRITLDTVRAGSTVAAMSGKLGFEWRDVCDGWAVNQRFGLRFTDRQGRQHWSDRRYLTWEAKDGTAFRFSIRAVRDNVVIEESEGQAVLHKDGSAGGEILFKLPSPYRAALPEGTIFPSTHFLRILEALEAPAGPRADVVFSGSEEDGLQRVNTFFGAEVDPGPESAESELGQLFGRRVRIGYFPYFARNLEADYEVVLQVRENGVLDWFVIDYADFSIKGVLDEWTELEAAGC